MNQTNNHNCNCQCGTPTVKLPFKGFDLAFDVSNLAALYVNEERVRQLIEESAESGVVREVIREMIQESLVDRPTRDEVQQMIDNSQKDKVTKDELEQALANIKANTFIIGEFYNFRSPELLPGFAPRYGSLLENADVLYPELYAFLQTPEGQQMCVTQTVWDEMNAVEPWSGIGGVPFYVVDSMAKTVRLPDTRGMYWEDAGFDGLDVGGVHGDAIRNITGTIDGMAFNGPGSGAFNATGSGNQRHKDGYLQNYHPYRLDASRVVPTANKNQPRAFGGLPCVYVGSVV